MENNKPTICINGEVYPLATTLRVAFKIQAQNEHRPYSAVFQDLADMPVEKQVDMVFASFATANPEVAATFSMIPFRDYFLDNFNIKELMEILGSIINGIMGKDDEDEVEGEDAPATTSASEKN